MGERRGPLDNSNAYVGTGYGMPHRAVPWGVQAPRTGEDRPAEQRASRELELATTAKDNRGLGRLSAGVTGLVTAVASVILLWVLSGVEPWHRIELCADVELPHGRSLGPSPVGCCPTPVRPSSATRSRECR